jgi:hypothetical protein
MLWLCDRLCLAVDTAQPPSTNRPTDQPHATVQPQTPQVAAPYALPGGMSVQIIDCGGATLSMVNSQTIAAFKVGDGFRGWLVWWTWFSAGERHKRAR